MTQPETVPCFVCGESAPMQRGPAALCDDCYDVADSAELAEVLEERDVEEQ